MTGRRTDSFNAANTVSNTGLSALRAVVRDELKRQQHAEVAVVQEQHPHASADDTDNYGCTVALVTSGVVLARVPVASARKGFASIPDVGDLVLVQFLHGDINAPVITGTFYNDEDRPPENDSGQVVLDLPSTSGPGEGVHALVTSEDEGRVTLTIGSTIVDLLDGDPAVRIDVGDGSAELVIGSDGSISIKSSASIALEGGDIELKGNNVKVEAQAELTLKGSVVNLN